MEKVALFAFNGEMMCFVHALLNALDMHGNGKEVALVFEGASVRLVPELEREDNPFHELYGKARSAGIVAGVCRACSSKLGVLHDVERSGLPLLDDMQGHPSMRSFMDRGYGVITV
ncbi:MAG: cytoplasmic protein [Desulfovibrio sp.]|jgi:hypothetical protein